MKQKAFTMVELLAVLVIISLILLVSAPPLLESLRKGEEKEYNQFLDKIYLASEVYVVENPNEFDWTKDNNYILLRNLINNDYLSGSIVNPNTTKPIYEEDSIIEVTKDEKNLLKFNYVYIVSE